jgi:hypothetical protein
VTSQPRRGGGGDNEGGYVKRITGDEREDEMDDNLRQVVCIQFDYVKTSFMQSCWEYIG